MDKLIKQLREDINDCGLDMGAGWDNFHSVRDAQATLDKLEKAINDLKSNTTDLKPIVFKKGDYLTYIGGSATKYLVIGEKYRTTWDSMNLSGRVAIIGINKKRLVMPLRFFTN